MSDLGILQHSLGLDQYGQGRAYRSHYVAGPGHHSYDECMALVERGFMVRHVGNALSGGSDIFYVTDAGRDFVANNSPKPPKLSRGQQRYRDFLAANCGMKFGEYLKWVSRREAP